MCEQIFGYTISMDLGKTGMWVMLASPDPFVFQNFRIGLRRYRVGNIQLRCNYFVHLGCSWRDGVALEFQTSHLG